MYVIFSGWSVKGFLTPQSSGPKRVFICKQVMFFDGGVQGSLGPFQPEIPRMGSLEQLRLKARHLKISIFQPMVLSRQHCHCLDRAFAV